MICVVDYGAGNLRSVVNAFEQIGESVVVTASPKDLPNASAVVLPGVGAFGDGMKMLKEGGLTDALREAVLTDKKPFLGICLGMQFLANYSNEHGKHQGLGWIDGCVEKLTPNGPEFRVPHIGWNSIDLQRPSILFAGIPDAPVFYFLHSWSFRASSFSAACVTATCWHGEEICAGVERDNVFGVQFHPEKSQRNGLTVLANFAKLA